MSTLVAHVGFYISVLIVTLNLTHAWLNTNFAVHAWNAFSKEQAATRSDLQTKVFARFGGWGDLVTCPQCSATWLSVLPIAGAWHAMDVSPWMPWLALFSVPVFAARLLPAQVTPPAARTFQAAAGNEHPVILDLMRKMGETPTAEPPELWNKLYAELSAPTTARTKAIVAIYRKQLELTKEGEARAGLQRAALGKIYDSGIR